MARVSTFLMVASLLVAGSAEAGQPRTHDGLFLRLSGGIAFANTSYEDDSGNDVGINGIGGHGNFAIGVMVLPNLAIHGTMWGWTLLEPDEELNGQVINGSGENVRVNGFGGGATYYLEPSNIFISASAGAGHLSFIDSTRENSDVGLAVDALLGKEWWLGNNWGLGMAGDLNFHSFPVEGVDNSTSGISFGILFTATMN